jgi:hypothetical protein
VVRPQFLRSAREHNGNIPCCENSQSPEKTDSDTQKQAAIPHHLPFQLEPLRFLPPPGGIILLSGTQLHVTVPNTRTSRAIALLFRTVHCNDVIARRTMTNRKGE